MDVLDPLRLAWAGVLLLAPAMALGWALGPAGTGWMPRIVWGLAASLALLMAGGVALHGLRALTAPGWLLVVVLLVATGWALGRWARQREASPLRVPQEAPARSALDKRQLALLLAALAIAVAAIFVARAGAEAALRAPTTELWVLNRQGQVVIGVRNREGAPLHYRLQWKTGGGASQSVDLPPLAADAVQEHAIPAVPATAAAGVPIEVRLYRAGETTPYRHVSFLP